MGRKVKFYLDDAGLPSAYITKYVSDYVDVIAVGYANDIALYRLYNATTYKTRFELGYLSDDRLYGFHKKSESGHGFYSKSVWNHEQYQYSWAVRDDEIRIASIVRR